MASRQLMLVSPSLRVFDKPFNCPLSCLGSVLRFRRPQSRRRRPRQSLQSFHSSPKVPGIDTDRASSGDFASLFGNVDQITFRGSSQTHGASATLSLPTIHDRLRQWERENGNPQSEPPLDDEDIVQPGQLVNMRARPRSADSLHHISAKSPDEDFSLSQSPGDEQYNEAPLKCGDLVELRLSGGGCEHILAIVTRNFQQQAQFYTMTGKWVHRSQRSVHFVVPGFVSPKLVEPLLSKLPSNDFRELRESEIQVQDISVPREIGAPLIDRMSAFYEKSESICLKRSEVLNKAHEILSDDFETLFITLPQITRKLLYPPQQEAPQQLEPEEFYAVHKALMQQDPGVVVQDSLGCQHRYFRIYSKEHVDMVDKVSKYIRDYQEYSTGEGGFTAHDKNGEKLDSLDRFIKNAKRAIEASRLNRVPTEHGSVGPDNQNRTNVTGPVKVDRHNVNFTKFDYSIIAFIQTYTLQEFPNSSPLNSLVPAILRATGMYEGYPLSRGTSFVFLQEIGVYTPWERRAIHDKMLSLPGHGISQQADDDLQRIESLPENFGSNLTDSMATLRKDWKDLKVFCIDDADAKEIDDGISVEKVQGNSSDMWIHIHVANPSAFLPPHFWISMRAQNLCQTAYTPERTYPMLPMPLVQENFSLGPDRPALTFSARLTTEGELVDYTVTPGVIRQVAFITPDTLDKVLNLPAAEKPRVLKVGRVFPPTGRKGLSRADALSESDRADLQSLMALAAARRRMRHLNGGCSLSRHSLEVSVHYGNLFKLPPSPAGRRPGKLWRGDPGIHIESRTFDPLCKNVPSIDSQRIVEECMVLASEVAGRWCRQRNMPVPYMSTANPSTELREFIQQKLVPAMSPEFNTPFLLGIEYVRQAQDVCSTTPGPALKYGLDVYTRCSSPLRRYTDLLVHWQIEAALRYEALGGDSAARGELHDHLPFSKSQVEDSLAWFRFRGRRASNAYSQAAKHWALLLLQRGHLFGEMELPKTFEMFVIDPIDPNGRGCYGSLLNPALAVHMPLTHEAWMRENHIQRGDRIEVEIDSINLYGCQLLVKPVRMIEKASGPYG